MIKIREFIQRAKTFINENPQRKKLLLIIFILAIIPLTVIAALTIQNLRQLAGGGTTVRIADESGNTLNSTSDPNVFIDINLNATTNWVLPNQPSAFNIKNNLVKSAYALTNQCSPPYQGFLGCFGSSSHPFGSACTSSCTTDSGQTGQYCYTSTKVGNICTNSSGQNGICNEQGACVATAYPTPVYSTPMYPTPTFITAPPATSTPSPSVTSTNQCDYFSKPDGCNNSSKFCFKGACIPCSTGFSNNDQTQGCEASSSSKEPTSQPTVSVGPTSGPTPTPIPNILVAMYIENKDSDGSSNGSEPLRITSGFESYINTLIPWKINDLLPGQTQTLRIVQITLFSNMGSSIALSASVNLVRPSYPISGTVVPTVIPPVSSTVDPMLNYKNNDLNNDSLVNCKDIAILISQYGQKRTNLSADLNHDGIVDGIDYNTIVRNYTPGDTTVCN